MLKECRFALRIADEAYDAEIAELIQAGVHDLKMAGIDVDGISIAVTYNDDGTATVLDSSDGVHPSILQAVKTYVRLHFQSPDDFDRLERTYNEQKSILMTASGHTEWGDEE